MGLFSRNKTCSVCGHVYSEGGKHVPSPWYPFDDEHFCSNCAPKYDRRDNTGRFFRNKVECNENGQLLEVVEALVINQKDALANQRQITATIEKYYTHEQSIRNFITSLNKQSGTVAQKNARKAILGVIEAILND